MANRKKEVYKSKPMTEQQRCIVHMVRNTLKYVANKDMKAFAKDLKTIYTSADEKTALKQLETVTEKWEPLYPHAMNRWKENWDAISPIFMFFIGYSARKHKTVELVKLAFMTVEGKMPDIHNLYYSFESHVFFLQSPYQGGLYKIHTRSFLFS